MSSIQLTDTHGFSMSVTNEGDKSSFLNRVLTDAEFVIDTADVQAIGKLPLGANPGPHLPLTLTAKGSYGIGVNGVASLKIDGSCTAKLSKGECGESLKPFDADLPGGGDGKAAGYLSFETTAQINTGISGTVDEFTFGLTRGNTVTLSNSKYFPKFASMTLVDATRELLGDLAILTSLSDIESLPPENICSLEGKGSLTFKASAGYQFFTNPLASVNIPIANTPLAVKACGNADLDFTVKVDSGFKISVLKSSPTTARLAVDRSRGTDFDTSFSVTAQVSATVESKDMLAMLLSLISPKADQEIEDLKTKLSDDERDAINDAIQCAIQNNFELGVQAEMESALNSDTLVLYEIDLDGLSDKGKAAVASALKGDFSELAEATEQDGITERYSVLTMKNTKTRRLTVHLLNIFQVGEVSSLISKETVRTTPAGDLVITDSLTAHKIDFLSFASKADRLRHVLFTSAMITSAYKGTKAELAAPELQCELAHFHYVQKAGADELRCNVNALQGLQLLSNDHATSASEAIKNQKPAPSTINMKLKLSADDCERLFLDGGKARSPDAYETIGKSAMYKLIYNDPSQSGQAGVLTTEEQDVWNKLKAATNSDQAAEALGPGTDPQLAPLYLSEMSRITWWAEHMNALAKCVEAFQSGGADLDPNSAGFQKLHSALTAEAKNVSALTEDYFSLPWGILAISQVLGFSPKVEVTYVSQPLSLSVSEPVTVVAAGAIG